MISVSVKGALCITEIQSVSVIIVNSGSNLDIEIPFYSDPAPSVNWIIGLPGSDEKKISCRLGQDMEGLMQKKSED